MVQKTYKAKLIKENKPSKLMFDVISCKPNKKYGYFEITTKIYHHQIITIHRFNEVDRVELYDEEDGKKPVKVIEYELH